MAAPKPIKKRIKKRYSDEEKANALTHLDANNGNVELTAHEMGIPRGTLQYWERGEVHPEVIKIKLEERLPLADRLEQLAHMLADALPDKIENANLQQAATSMAIAIDKMRLLRGEPTSIAQRQSSDEQLFNQLQRMDQCIKQLKSVDGANSENVSRAEAGTLPVARPD